MSPAYLKRVRERGRNAEVIHGKCYDRQPNPVDGGGAATGAEDTF